METKKKKLPVGIEMFRDIREHDFYYIDKTGFTASFGMPSCSSVF